MVFYAIYFLIIFMSFARYHYNVATLGCQNRRFYGLRPVTNVRSPGHALQHGRHNTLIELRSDLIGDASTQGAWAARLAAALEAALRRANV